MLDPDVGITLPLLDLVLLSQMNRSSSPVVFDGGKMLDGSGSYNKCSLATHAH